MSRRRFYYDKDLKRCVEVGADWQPEPVARVELMTGSCHADVVAPDGTLIDTRAKREAWKRANGVEDEADCKEFTARNAAEREKWRRGEQDSRHYVEAAREAYERLKYGRG